jgi:hypothetical protein
MNTTTTTTETETAPPTPEVDDGITEKEKTAEDFLGEIGVRRRCAIHDADRRHGVEYVSDEEYVKRTKREKESDPFGYACKRLGLTVWSRLSERLGEGAPSIDHNDPEIRQLCDEVEKLSRESAEDDIAHQGEHQEIEDKYNALIIEYFTKHPVAKLES